MTGEEASPRPVPQPHSTAPESRTLPFPHRCRFIMVYPKASEATTVQTRTVRPKEGPPLVQGHLARTWLTQDSAQGL